MTDDDDFGGRVHVVYLFQISGLFYIFDTIFVFLWNEAGGEAPPLTGLKKLMLILKHLLGSFCKIGRWCRVFR
jgi:hypothetical protein